MRKTESRTQQVAGLVEVESVMGSVSEWMYHVTAWPRTPEAANQVPTPEPGSARSSGRTYSPMEISQ